MTATIHALPPRTYDANLFEMPLPRLAVKIAGTLDGFLDLSIRPESGTNLTHTITCDDARSLAAALLSAASDVQRNCLYERDALLMPDPAQP